MLRSAYLAAVLVLSSAACGGSDGEDQSGKTVTRLYPVDLNNDGLSDGFAIDTNGDGAPDGVDTNMDNQVDTALPAGMQGGNPGGTATPGGGGGPGSSGGNNGRDAGGGGIFCPDCDAGSDRPDGGVVIDIPERFVTCGGKDCNTVGETVCCDKWTPETGFESGATCTSSSSCSTGGFGSGPRNVTRSCDEPSDCGSGAALVCCFVRRGMPVFDVGTEKGPGASTSCQTVDVCRGGFSASGQFTGAFACKTDQDCKKLAAGGIPELGNSTCQPETANDQLTWALSTPRPDVKLCR